MFHTITELLIVNIQVSNFKKMSFLKNIFAKKEQLKIATYEDFWTWFIANEKVFSKVLKSRQNIEKHFVDIVGPKLEELRSGYYFLAGMYDASTIELILTAESTVKNIVFVEELVKAAPIISGWKFTALKPALDVENVSINMEGFVFNADNISFYSNDTKAYPDEIDICIIPDDLTIDNFRIIDMGVFVFLENYLGELHLANAIDNIQIIEKVDAEKELIPISKLKDFLIWREKEFIEKYDDIRYDTENDAYNLLEAELENSNKISAIVNANLLNWDRKSSHPWICTLTIRFRGEDNYGLPSQSDYKILTTIEEDILNSLLDKEGHLYIGRETANNEREIYFACKDFRKPSKVMDQVQQKYLDVFEIDYKIFRDKYWKTFERFNVGDQLDH